MNFYSWTPVNIFFIVEVCLQIDLTSKRFELQMPDWTQVKENLNIFNLGPIWDL